MLSCFPTPESFCFVPPTNLHLSIKSGQDVGIKLRPPQHSSSSYHHRKNFSSSSSFQKLQKERTYPIRRLPSPPQFSFHGPGSAVVRPPLPVPYSSPNPGACATSPSSGLRPPLLLLPCGEKSPYLLSSPIITGEIHLKL